jgi:glycosyltransferase involved in cell wall biosynthesis
MKNNVEKKIIGIFRHTLLPPSETFIAEQSSHITKFDVHYFGRERGEGDFNLPNCHLIQEKPHKRSPGQVWYTLTGKSKKLTKMMKAVGPQLLHAHFGVEGVYAMPYAKSLGIPLITTFHGFDATRTKKALMRSGKPAWLRYVRNMATLAKEGDLFIAVSEFIQNRLIERGFPPGRIIVHHIGIDTDKFNTTGYVDDGRTVLSIGRLVEKKGIRYLIRAIAQVKKEVPDVKLEIIGDGPQRHYLEQLASELGVSDQVSFRGSCTQNEVIESLKKASVFCLPSVTASDGDAEGMGLVLLETSACMKPVVASQHGGIRSAVRDGENGFLVSERDIDELQGRLVLLLKDQSLRHKMGKNGRTIVENEFDIRKQTKKLEQIYTDLIEP